MNNIVVCQECGTPMCQLHSHLQHKHDMTVDEYRQKYTDARVHNDKMREMYDQGACGGHD